MGSMTDAKIVAWQKKVGIEPAHRKRAEILAEIARLAAQLIGLTALESSGIRDGAGYWCGSDPLDGTIHSIADRWHQLNERSLVAQFAHDVVHRESGVPEAGEEADRVMNDDATYEKWRALWSREHQPPAPTRQGKAINICIKSNNTICNESCTLCGNDHRVEEVAFFIEGTEQPVCRGCAYRLDPELSKAAFYANLRHVSPKGDLVYLSPDGSIESYSNVPYDGFSLTADHLAERERAAERDAIDENIPF